MSQHRCPCGMWYAAKPRGPVPRRCPLCSEAFRRGQSRLLMRSLRAKRKAPDGTRRHGGSPKRVSGVPLRDPTGSTQ